MLNERLIELLEDFLEDKKLEKDGKDWVRRYKADSGFLPLENRNQPDPKGGFETVRPIGENARRAANAFKAALAEGREETVQALYNEMDLNISEVLQRLDVVEDNTERNILLKILETYVEQES